MSDKASNKSAEVDIMPQNYIINSRKSAEENNIKQLYSDKNIFTIFVYIMQKSIIFAAH